MADGVRHCISMVETTGRIRIPGQIGVALLRDRKQHQVECALLLSRSVRGLFLGISQSQEQLPVHGVGNTLIGQATMLGRQTSPADGNSQRVAYSTSRQWYHLHGLHGLHGLNWCLAKPT